GLLLELLTSLAQLGRLGLPAEDLFLAGLHAVTIGFISMMIMGMAARIVPAFAATRLHSRSLFVLTWWCLMLGTLLRVPAQALYSSTGGAIGPLLGLSGIVQLAGMMLFTWNLWRPLAGSVTDRAALLAPRSNALQPPHVQQRGRASTDADDTLPLHLSYLPSGYLSGRTCQLGQVTLGQMARPAIRRLDQRPGQASPNAVEGEVLDHRRELAKPPREDAQHGRAEARACAQQAIRVRLGEDPEVAIVETVGAGGIGAAVEYRHVVE